MLLQKWSAAVPCHKSEKLSVVGSKLTIRGFAQPVRPFQHRFEHGGEVTGGRINDRSAISCSGLASVPPGVALIADLGETDFRQIIPRTIWSPQFSIGVITVKPASDRYRRDAAGPNPPATFPDRPTPVDDKALPTCPEAVVDGTMMQRGDGWVRPSQIKQSVARLRQHGEPAWWRRAAHCRRPPAG